MMRRWVTWQYRHPGWWTWRKHGCALTRLELALAIAVGTLICAIDLLASL